MLGADGNEIGAEPEREAVLGHLHASGVVFLDAVLRGAARAHAPALP
jgi:hypothetical protein